MKIKDILSGEQIVQICTDVDFKPYCRKEYCPHYNGCKSKGNAYIHCEDAMANYFESEETEVSYLLRRLEEEKDKLITFNVLDDKEGMERINLFNRLIQYIKEKESIEN